MNNTLNLKYIIGFSEIFTEEARDLNTYLSGIKRSTLLDATSYFLGFYNKNSQFEDFKNILELFFCNENTDFAIEVYNSIKIIQKEKNIKTLLIISPLTALHLFEFCFDEMIELETQNQVETERNIFKAILLLNEIIFKSQDKSIESTNLLNKDIRFAALTLTQSFAYNDFVNFESTEVIITQFIKSIYLFEFLEANLKSQKLLTLFLEYFKCKTWKEYLLNILPLLFSIIKSKEEASIDIRIDDDNFSQFLENFTIIDTNILKDYDFKNIRSKPLYKNKEGIYRVIFSLFVFELIHKGTFFKLNEINNGLDQNIMNFRSFYCDEFSEKYLLYRTLNNIFQNRYKEFSGAKIKELGIEAEPDYYVRNGKHLFLFESKDIMINATIKGSYDFMQYEPEFKKKLYFEEKPNGKIRNKAVKQLVKNIEKSLTLKFPFDNSYKSDFLIIYPILILHDNQFNVAGLNVIVNKWFKNELEILKNNGLNIKNIKPIVIINIDTLILHQDLFKSRTINFKYILDEYFKYITLKKNKKYQNLEHEKIYRKRTVIPFSIFLGNYINKKNLKKHPKIFMEFANKLAEN